MNSELLRFNRARVEVLMDRLRALDVVCRKAGLLSEGPVYVDTTLVQAAVVRDHFQERPEKTNGTVRLASVR